MKPLKKPSVKTPYETISEINPPWKSEMEEAVKKRIKFLESAIKKEAEKSGDGRMADEEFLYSRFKDNVSTGMMFANWEVLKYFSKILLCKWYYEHIGEWKYTEEDVEMYRYFRDIEVSKKTRCRPKFLQFNFVSTNSPGFDMEVVQNKTLLYYELDDGRLENVITLNYFDLYHSRWLLINDMEANCLMQGKYMTDDLFDSKDMYRSLTLEYTNAIGHIAKISDTPMFTNYDRKIKDTHEKPIDTIFRKIDESLKNNEEYVKLSKKIVAIIGPEIEKVLNSCKYEIDSLNPTEILALKKFVESYHIQQEK
jgi:hypothetical protein